MSWPMVMGIAFLLVALAEFGDKTQLMTVSLASRYDKIPVFWGVFLGMSLVTVMGVIVGTILYSHVPLTPLKIIAAAIFILFGIHSILSDDDDKLDNMKDSHVFRNSFVLSSVAELGDKTQFAVIALTARYAAPVPVLVGSLAGLALVIGLGVLLGWKLSQHVEKGKIKIGTAVLFIAIGTLFFVEAVLM